MAETANLVEDFTQLELAARRDVTKTAHAAGPAPDFKARADKVVALQAVVAALHAVS